MQGRACRTAAAGAALALVTLLAATAAAHPLVERGRALYEEGEMVEALAAFTAAEQASDLTLRDLIRMIETRVLCYRVLGDDAAVETELVRLASVAPDHRFSAEAPPELQEAFARVRGRLRGRPRVLVATAPSRAGLVLRARVEDDPGGLARRIAIATRGPGGEWREGEGDAAEVTVAPGDRVEYHATAFGPGGAPIATAGTRQEPLRVEREEPSAASGPPWLWIGIGAGALAIATVVVVLLLSGGNTDTQVSSIAESR